jgi:uncharacterized protein (UPF0276 family)
MPIPASAGIGLRFPHVEHVLAARPAVSWFEVHSENYFAEGGPAIAALERVRAAYPVSLHGVGLALGSFGPLDEAHVAKLKRLVDRIEPALVSEHLAWGRVHGRHYNDLLPLPLTEEALRHVCARVSEAQDALGRALLIENVSSYYAFPESTLGEPEFLAALAARTGCKLLLDVNNVHVSAHNQGWGALEYLGAIPPCAVAEIHLAGYEASGTLLVDTHGAPVAPEVWTLYEAALARFGALPTLIEWDTAIPSFDVLQREAATAQALLDRRDALAA